MGDYFEEEMDTGPDTAGIVIDDYDGYDEEYFEDDAGTFSQEDEKPAKLGGASSDRLASRLSVDAPPCSAAASANSVAASEFHKDKAGARSVTEEVEEIEEEVIEEEEEEEEYERFNRTEVADSRSSVLNRLGPRLGGVADTTASPEHEQPAADAAPAGSAGRAFPSGQCIGVAKRLLFISNLPIAVTPQQVLAHLRCILVGQVTIELFDGIYNGCCVMGLSTAGAVRQMMANIAKTPFLGRKIFAKQMQPLDHEMFLRYKMAAQPSSDTDLNSLWVVVLHNVSFSTVEVLLRTAMLEEVPSLLNLQLIRKNKKKGNQLALVVAPSKQVADSVANAWHERVVDGHQLKTCPLYRGYRRAASGNKGPPLVCTRSEDANTAAGAVSKPQVQQKQAVPGAGGGQKGAPCTTTKMNNMHELLQHTKGHACRVNVLNVSYSATEDDVIEAVNAKVGGLQYILPFRNNQGCFNGNMLLEFVTPAAAKKFFTVMQKFVLKQRQIFLRMDTDAPRDLQGNVLSDRAKSKSSVESPFGKPPFDGPPQSMRHDLPGIGPPADVPIANYGHPLPPIHPMDCGPVGHEIPPVIDFNGPASSLIGARLEPMLPPAPPALPPAPFSEPVHETYGLSPDYLANLNVELPLVPKVLISNVDPRASENDVGDLLSVAGTVVTVQINRHLQQAIVEMAHPVEAVEAISRLNHHPLHERRIAVRLCRRRDFEIVNGLPVTEDIQLAPDVGPNPGMPYAFGQTPPNHLANPMLPMQERPLPPPGGHNFRGPTDTPFNAVQSDDLRSSLSRPGFPGRRYPSPPAVARGDVPRDSSSILSKKLEPPIEENSGFGRGGNSASTRGRGNLAGTPFWHSRGGLGFSAMSRGNPVKSLAGSHDDKPVGQASSVAGRGAANALSTRGASNTSGGRGQAPFGRGGNNAPAGASKNPVDSKIDVQAGRGAANSAAAGRGAANIAAAGRGAANIAAAGRGAANSSPAGRGAANNSPAGRGAAVTAPAGRGAAVTAPAGRGAAVTAPAGRGAAVTAPAGRGAAVTAPIGRGAAVTAPINRAAAVTAPVGRGAANSSPAGRGAANSSPAGRGAASSSPAGRGAANSSPAGRGAANSSPAGRGAANSSPASRGTVASSNFASVGNGTANKVSATVGSGRNSVFGGDVNGGSAGKEPASSAFSNKVRENSINRNSVSNAPAKSGSKDGVDTAGANATPTGKEIAFNSTGKPAAVTSFSSRNTASCLTNKDGPVSSTRTEIETNPSKETSAAALTGTGAAIAALANRGTMPSSVDAAMGMNSTSRGVSNYSSFGGKSSPNDSARERANVVPFGSRTANTLVNKDSTESVVSSGQGENVARELSNVSPGSFSNFDSPYMKAKSNDSLKERGSIVPGFAGSASSSGIFNQTERNNSFHRTATFTTGRDKINVSNDGSRDDKIPVIGKEICSAGPSDKEKAYAETRPVESKIPYQNYGGRDMVERDSQVHRSDDLNANYESQIAGVSPITVVMDAAAERKPLAKHSEHRGIAAGNVSANFNSVRNFQPDSGSNAVPNSAFSPGGVWRSGSAGVPKQIDAVTSVRPHSKERNIGKDEDKWTVSGTKRDLADNQSDLSQSGPISKRMRNDRPSHLPSDSGHTVEQLSLGDRSDKNPYLRDANRLNATNRFEQNTSLNSQITNVSDQTYRIPSVWEGQSSARDKTDSSNFRNSELTDRAKSQNLRYSDEANREPKFDRVQTSLFESRNISNVPLTVDYGHKSGVKNVQMASNKVQYSPARDDNPYLRGDSPVRHASSNKSRSTNWPNRLNRDDESNRKVGNAPLHNRERGPVERSWTGTREAYPKAITKDWQHGSTPRDLTYGRQAGSYSDSSRFNDIPSSARMDYPPSDFYGRSSDLRASHLPPPSSGGPPRSTYPDVHGPLIGASLGRSSLFAPSQSAKLVINNLPSQANKRDISELCGRYGVVRDIDHDTRAFKSRVVFANAQDARIAARELNDFVYRGSTLRALVV